MSTPSAPNDFGDRELRPADAASPRQVVRISNRHLWIAGLITAFLLGAGIWLVIAKLPQLLQTPTEDGAEGGAGAGSSARRIQATLFYVSENSQELVAVARAVPYGGTPLEQARRILEAAVSAPPEGLRSPIPAGTTVRSIFLVGDGRAFVDLGGAIVSGHSGGTLNEALAVYAIVNAITVNMPNISAVQILVEGKQVDTLAGHLDLRYPLGKALEWVRKGS